MPCPPMGKHLAGLLQAIQHRPYIRLVGMSGGIRPELGHHAAGALLPVDHQVPGGGIAENITQQIRAAIAVGPARSEEHTSELQSLMRISYAVFCLKKKNKNHIPTQ